MPGLGWTIFYLCLNAHLESAAQTTQSQWPQKPNSLPWPKPNWSEFLADSAACFAKIFFGGAHCATAQTRSEIVWAFRQGNQRESFLYNFFKKIKLNCPNISQIMNLQVSWDCSTKRLHPHSCHLIKKNSPASSLLLHIRPRFETHFKKMVWPINDSLYPSITAVANPWSASEAWPREPARCFYNIEWNIFEVVHCLPYMNYFLPSW